jgi:hypothetical protein
MMIAIDFPCVTAANVRVCACVQAVLCTAPKMTEAALYDVCFLAWLSHMLSVCSVGRVLKLIP